MAEFFGVDKYSPGSVTRTCMDDGDRVWTWGSSDQRGALPILLIDIGWGRWKRDSLASPFPPPKQTGAVPGPN